MPLILTASDSSERSVRQSDREVGYGVRLKITQLGHQVWPNLTKINSCMVEINPMIAPFPQHCTAVGRLPSLTQPVSLSNFVFRVDPVKIYPKNKI